MGRLDKESEGLLIVTNDGDLSLALTHPRYKIDKEYEVLLDKPFDPAHREKLLRGFHIIGGRAKMESIQLISGRRLRLVLTQGIKRQIRLMLYEMGYEVEQLKRLRIGSVELGNLPLGHSRLLTPAEVDSLRLATSPAATTKEPAARTAPGFRDLRPIDRRGKGPVRRETPAAKDERPAPRRRRTRRTSCPSRSNALLLAVNVPPLGDVPPLAANVPPLVANVLPLVVNVPPLVVNAPPLAVIVPPLVVNAPPLVVNVPLLAVNVPTSATNAPLRAAVARLHGMGGLLPRAHGLNAPHVPESAMSDASQNQPIAGKPPAEGRGSAMIAPNALIPARNVEHRAASVPHLVRNAAHRAANVQRLAPDALPPAAAGLPRGLSVQADAAPPNPVAHAAARATASRRGLTHR